MSDGRASGRVLVVDDQKNWRIALETLLQDYGHIVWSAETLPDALSAIERETFDVVVIDVRLVDEDFLNVDGVHLLEALRDKEHRPKVVLITGYPEVGQLAHERFAPDVDAFVLKAPRLGFDAHGFGELIRSLLSDQ